MRIFTHIVEEANRRELDLREFGRNKLTAAEAAEAYQGLPAKLVEMLIGPAAEGET